MSEVFEKTLIFPDKVTISLQDENHQPVPLAGVLLSIQTFARRRNDFLLQPFVTNNHGITTITRRELVAEAEAHYDFGLMDYASIEYCHPKVEISAITTAAIKRQIETRLQTWTTLSKAEAKRWSSIEELIATLRQAANDKVIVTSDTALWNIDQAEYECVLQARLL